MKLLAILGSPRRNSNTEVLLDRAIEGASKRGMDVQKVVLSELDFSPCIECGGCDETGICILKDDLTSLYEALIEANAVLVASPIFFGSLTAQTKAMIDRMQALWVRRYVLKKRLGRPGRKRRGYFICTSSANRRRFFENAREIVKNFFAALDVKYTSGLYVPNVEKKGDVLKIQSALKRASLLVC